jgi:hypothetical protein
MSAIKAYVGGINRRFFLGALAIGWAASASQSFASTPPLHFLGVRVLVVDYFSEPTSPELNLLISKGEIHPQLVSYIEREFARLGIDIPVISRQKFGEPPAGIHPDAVLYVSIRVDLSETSVGESKDAVVVGAVSLSLVRQGTVSWSSVPYELFASPQQDGQVRSAVIASAQEHLDKALIEPVAKFRQQ